MIFKLKVYYEDTDAGGIVYYANYLRYLERARTELIQTKGFSNKILKDKYGIFLVVKSCNIDFNKPALLEDELTIQTIVNKISKVQILLSQNIFRKKENILKADIRLAIINQYGKISKLPENIISILSAND